MIAGPFTLIEALVSIGDGALIGIFLLPMLFALLWLIEGDGRD